MKRIVIFLVGLYLVSAVGAWALLSKNTGTNVTLARELATAKKMLADEQAAGKAARAALEKKIADAQANVAFLSLALCPALEATDKDALCIKNSSEWFSQTIQAGALITDADAKERMTALTISLGEKKHPTARQFYEALKPIEVSSLAALTENLK